MKITKRIKKLLSRKEKTPEPPKPRYMWDQRGGWGDAIQFFNEYEHGAETQSVVGWQSNKPRIGDYFRVPFGKGQAIFEFTSIRRCGDPPDMFFADIVLLGYEKDLELDEHVRPYSDRKGLNLL